MSSRKAVLASALLLGVGAGLAYLRHRMTAPKVLRVGYPFAVLRQDQKLLDPDNTEFVYQFYLLENLAAGLVRDSSRAPLGYEPCLARSWERVSATRWAFELQPGLLWSDGSPIEPAAVASHLQALAKGKSRHIIYLKDLSRVAVEGRRLLLDFAKPVNDGIIHELSLADAALLHPGNRGGDWSVTSGPFSVGSYEPGKRLRLRRNPHYPSSVEYPKEVELVDFTMDTIGRFFDSEEVDLLKVPAPAFRPGSREVLAQAPQKMRGYPTWIYYLHFNARKPLWRDGAARRDFARVVEEALDGLTVEGLQRERQMIPAGFSGRLEQGPSAEAASTGRLAGKHVKIGLLPAFADVAPLRDALRKAFEKAGASVEFTESRGLGPSDDADAQLTQFSGNQRDAMGSWQFMFSPEHGDLAPFRAEVEPFFGQVMSADGKDAREAALRRLHAHVLEQVYVVPLFIAPDIIASSRRVDLSRLNPFDMRLRFHEVQWK